MSLEEYFKKRDFATTPEPKGTMPNEDGELRFVVQRHQASRLHYDLRLEMQGTLKSWAVPKGPSLNPADKRLAIQTEDHPLQYLTFHGTIPKGNYGAGVMEIWDTGTYRGAGGINEKEMLQQFIKGDLKIEFFGKKIRGTFALVRTSRGDKGNQWLLIKKTDDFSIEEKYDAEDFPPYAESKKPQLPKEPKVKTLQPTEAIKPMLATATKKIFNDPEWIYELKWDGYRMIASVKDGNVELWSRNGISFNTKFPRLLRDLEQLEHNVVLDGEVVVVDKKGIPDFQKLQNYDETTLGELRFYVFDMLFLNGHSMLELPLVERKSLIKEVIEDTYHTFYCDHLEGMGSAFFKRAIDSGMEGVIAKKADSTYTPGYRSENWLKIKAVNSTEAIICGYTESDSGNLFGSLILGMFKDEKLRYIGNVGSGFSAKDQRKLLAKFSVLETDESPFEEKINLKGRKATWMKPVLICEVHFTEWTKTGSLRHPVFKGLRTDKDVPEITREKVVETPPSASPESSSSGSGSSKAGHLEIGGIQVPFNNLEKIYWPESGYTKYDLIDYYLNISEVILPYLIDRPQNLHRHPNGINQPGFYQKDNEGILPDWIETIKIHSKSSEKDIEYMLCQKEATLLYMANLGCIEINPWSSRIQNLENPDFTVIDIDPSEKNTFEEVIVVAQAAKEVLDMAGVDGYCKTSGSSGIHIYLPLGAEYSYDEGRDFTKLLCYFINEMLPEITSMERNVKKRGGKIYLDFLQNRRGQTLAAPYCARPKPGATVSAPLKWEEVKSGLQLADFTIKTMPKRIEKVGDLFTGVLGKGLDMEAALEKLNE
ncbi:DNA ligase D [Antarcticibacterium flavum]|uniref:DNA ligase (ATP) n=1 Tax=Antarcticibacterium flavum TaxID=2058175 RepID=A0A5B7X2Q8_9FLAO|nr:MULTISPECIES: DNA ligase D [Antarcticibacterium]MCM4161635.1 DNA ligase D [Antarcticibacterium sp. W02-3]QCY68951.1 DNA ligase D [Antarcticibacterium flavum]